MTLSVLKVKKKIHILPLGSQICLINKITHYLYFSLSKKSVLFIGYQISRILPAALRNRADNSAGISNTPTSFRKKYGILFFCVIRKLNFNSEVTGYIMYKSIKIRCAETHKSKQKKKKSIKMKRFRMPHHLWRGRCRFCGFLHCGSISMLLIKSKYNQKHNLTLKNPQKVSICIL